MPEIPADQLVQALPAPTPHPLLKELLLTACEVAGCDLTVRLEPTTLMISPERRKHSRLMVSVVGDEVAVELMIGDDSECDQSFDLTDPESIPEITATVLAALSNYYSLRGDKHRAAALRHDGVAYRLRNTAADTCPVERT